MERLTIDELIAHCDRQLTKMPSGNIFYQEHESVRAYLQILRHYVGIGTVDQFRDALRRTDEHDKAVEEGRLVELSEPMIPMMAGDDPMDTDVYCPRCGHDLSGGWSAEHPEEWKLYQCPNCGQSIDDCMVVSHADGGEFVI